MNKFKRGDRVIAITARAAGHSLYSIGDRGVVFNISQEFKQLQILWNGKSPVNWIPISHIKLLPLKDIAQEVGIDGSDIQQLYQTDTEGNIIFDENGNAKWNDIMAEKQLHRFSSMWPSQLQTRN